VKLRPIAEQVMVITGASSGIGLLTARKAAAAGAKVMLVARNETALAMAVQEIRADGGIADYAVADIGDAAQVAQAVAKTIETFGRIDTWINNAGVAIYAMLEQTPHDEHERLFRTDYFGVVHGTVAALPHLRKQGGALVTVGSIACDLPSPLLGAYTAAKHAVKGYINSLRIELDTAGAPISVTLVKPAGIDTPIGQHAANHEGHEALIPPPVYDPALVADVVLDVAQHPRREITVGGVGRAQVLAGTHFPRLLEKLAPILIPLLTDRNRPPTPRNSLYAPHDDGRVRSGTEHGRPFSLYTSTVRHRGWLIGGIAALAAGAIGAAVVRNRIET
jgi:short-subunit dehydrogenase